MLATAVNIRGTTPAATRNGNENVESDRNVLHLLLLWGRLAACDRNLHMDGAHHTQRPRIPARKRHQVYDRKIYVQTSYLWK